MLSQKLPTRPTCPRCAEVLNGVTDPRGRATPKPGDVSVCARCGELLAFTEGLLLRSATARELAELHPDDRRTLDEYARICAMARGN